MSGPSALRTVIRFEFVRTVRKPAFWLAALAVPVIMVVVGALVTLSSSSATEQSQAQADERFSFEYVDASGIVSAEVAEKLGGHEADSAEQGVADVRAGRVDAFFAYPADPSTEAVEVAGAESGVFANGRYGAVAQSLLQASAEARIGSPVLAAIARGQVAIQTTTYADGQVSHLGDAVLPGLLFVLLLFLSITLLGNSVLTATTEEKENRVAEILLTSVRSETLITGKILALSLIGLVQIAVVAAPVVIGYALFRENLRFPDLDLSTIVFDPQRMIVGLLLLLAGFALAMTTLVAIGSAVPSAKEAGPFYAVAIVATVIPLYLFALIISTPGSPVVQVLTYFPFSAGVTALIRNAFGSLQLWEAAIVFVVLVACSYLMLRIAVRAFRRGMVEYSRRLSLRELLGMPARSR